MLLVFLCKRFTNIKDDSIIFDSIESICLTCLLNSLMGEKSDMQSRNRTYQLIAMVALVISVCALTVGFAAFVIDLNKNSTTKVISNVTNLDVAFSISNSEVVPGTIAGIMNDSDEVGTATIEGTSLTSIKANFTKPGQVVTYAFNVYNNGNSTAYLTGIDFQNLQAGLNKVCVPTAINGATNYAEACSDIVIKLSVDSLVKDVTDDKTAFNINDTKGLASKKGYKVTVEVAYPEDGHTSDGGFTVSFGDIKLIYSSIKAV